MKIISAKQTRELDRFTIKNKPILSIDLMEVAAKTFTDWFIRCEPNQEREVLIFCSKGNNGGDGLAIGRLLQEKFYNVHIIICHIQAKESPDFTINKNRLPKRQGIKVTEISSGDTFPELPENFRLIDALFGSGLDRPIEGYWSHLINYLNENTHTCYAVDIPSGLYADRFSDGPSINADYTFSFECPKLCFLMPENEQQVGHWEYGSIGLDANELERLESPFSLLEMGDVKKILKKKAKFSHKGHFGHSLIIAGSKGMVGAALLSAHACLKTGSGLVSLQSPSCAYTIAQSYLPEIMVNIDQEESIVSMIPNLSKYNAIGIGPGLGTHKKTKKALKDLLKKWQGNLVLDADALNIISKTKGMINRIPPNSILTPHPKEFERLFGPTKDNFDLLTQQQQISKERSLFIILKGKFTKISTPDGHVYFNSTGNPGMATAGTGDVLTGMVTGFLAQNYSPLNACLLAVYIHGLAGDLCLDSESYESLIASDLINHIGPAINKIRNDA